MYLPIVLFFIFVFSILLSFLSLISKSTAMEIVDEMGIGWNLANTFDCFDNNAKFQNPDDLITLWGNQIPKKELFVKIKKSGFKTIRIPITWIGFMDSSDNVSSEWMKRIKEVVDWILSLNMFCIINVYIFLFILRFLKNILLD